MSRPLASRLTCLLGGLALGALVTAVAVAETTPRYELVLVDDGDAYVVDHDLTATDCMEALAHTLTGAPLVCEVQR